MNLGNYLPADGVPRRPRVLVVDDDRGVRTVMATFLERAGFAVTTATDGVDALQVMHHGFDLVTTDIDMPRMNGHEFIRRLHAILSPPIPVVIVTGQGQDTNITPPAPSCLVLHKPVPLGELAQTLWLLLASCRHDPTPCAGCPVPESDVPIRGE